MVILIKFTVLLFASIAAACSCPDGYACQEYSGACYTYCDDATLDVACAEGYACRPRGKEGLKCVRSLCTCKNAFTCGKDGNFTKCYTECNEENKNIECIGRYICKDNVCIRPTWSSNRIVGLGIGGFISLAVLCLLCAFFRK